MDPRVVGAFAGVDAIIHAGDVCSDRVLLDLEAIAPVTAVAGNCDPLTSGLPQRAIVEFAGVRILVIHDFGDLGPISEGIDVVICGHTHRPREEWHGHVLVVNPGSASQRRSMPSRSVALLEIGTDSLSYRLVSLDEGPQR